MVIGVPLRRDVAIFLKCEYLGALETRHVAFDGVADLGLNICEVTITLRKRTEQVCLEFKVGRRIDRVEAVLFVNGLTQHDAPTA